MPELASLDGDVVHEPWTITESDQLKYGFVPGEHYPLPIVDHLEAARHARDRIYAVRRGEGFSEEASRIQDKHGSRKSGIAATRRAKKQKASPQLHLGF